MTRQLCSRPRVPIRRFGILAVALLLVLVVRQRAMATLVLAQGHGTACTTRISFVNAFGQDVGDDGTGVLPNVNGADQRRLPNIDVGLHGEALDHVGGRWDTADGNASSASPLDAAVGTSKPDEFGIGRETGTSAFTGSANLRCGYATATDRSRGYLSLHVADNQRKPAGFTVSSWTIESARQLVQHDHRAVNFTFSQTNQTFGAIGVGRLIPPNGIQTGYGPGFSYTIDRYKSFYTTISLRNQRPVLSLLMQLK